MSIKNNKGFSLVELMVSLGILAVVTGAAATMMVEFSKQQVEVLQKSKLLKTMRSVQQDVLANSVYYMADEPPDWLDDNSEVTDEKREQLFSAAAAASDFNQNKCYNDRGGLEFQRVQEPDPSRPGEMKDVWYTELTADRVATLKAEGRCSFQVQYLKYKMKNKIYGLADDPKSLKYLPMNRFLLKVMYKNKDEDKTLYLTTINLDVLSY